MIYLNQCAILAGKGVGLVQCGVSNPDCTNTLFENKEPIFTKPRISCRRIFFSDKRSVWIYLFGCIYLSIGSMQKFNICRYLFQTLYEKFQIPYMNFETSVFAPTILSWKTIDSKDPILRFVKNSLREFSMKDMFFSLCEKPIYLHIVHIFKSSFVCKLLLPAIMRIYWISFPRILLLPWGATHVHGQTNITGGVGSCANSKISPQVK